MATSIFVNLPTTDLDRAKAFYAGLGWRIDPKFTDENAASVQIDENLYLMVLSRDFFATFTDKPIADPSTSVQVEVALTRDSRADVDALIEKAIAAGGREHRQAQELGFMYARDFEDPDGNLFSAVWMDPVAVAEGPQAVLDQDAGSADQPPPGSTS